MDARLNSLFRQLEQLSTQKNVKDELQTVLEELAPLAEAHGLTAAQIARGYDLALGGHLLPPQALALLPLLLPRAPLSSQPVLRILSILGEPSHNKPLHRGRVDYKVQKRALGQLTVLVQVGGVSREGREVLERCWGVLERGLEYRALRDATASLLCLVTRRIHVQQARIAHLQHVIRSTEAPSPSLFRLLDIFRSFYPELVLPSGVARSGGAGGLGKALEEWKERVRELLREGEGEVGGGDGREAKRRKTTQAYIPLGATFTSTSSSTPLSDITSLTSLASQIEKLDLPSQAGSVLSSVPGAESTEVVRSEEDRTKAWALLLACGFGGEDGQLLRLESFITSSLRHEMHELDETADGAKRIEDLLCRIRELCEMGGELLEGLEPFLAEYLQTWNGASHREVIFDLVSLIKPRPYEILHGHILVPLQALAAKADAAWLAAFIDCLREMVQNWAVRDDWSGEELKTAFGQVDEEGAYLASLQAVLEYADRIIDISTQSFPHSLPLRCASLAFYEAVLTFPLDYGLAVVIIPSPTFTYLCLLADEAMSVSRITGIIHSLREVLTGETTAVAKNDPRNLSLVTFLNNYLRDFVNALWQKKFLAQNDTKALDMTSEQIGTLNQLCATRDQALGAAVGLTMHGALSSIALDFLAHLEEQASSSPRYTGGPITTASLKSLSSQGGLSLTYPDFRVSFLEHLQAQGADGVQKFLFASLSKLARRSSSLGGSQSMSQGREGSVMNVMPVPAIPPKIVEEILKQLPPAEDDTVSTLLACTLVSHTFSAIAKLDSIWSGVASYCWILGRVPVFVELSNEEDKAEMELAFPYREEKSCSVYQGILARPHIKRIINRPLAALLAEPTSKIPHVLAIVELGEQNTFPFLDELAFMTSDESYPEDWLARKYWARQARGAIWRRKAVDVWRRIGQGWDGVEAFCEGVFAFSAFRDSQDWDEVTLEIPSFVDKVQEALDATEAICRCNDQAPRSQVLGFMLNHHLLVDGFHLDPLDEEIRVIFEPFQCLAHELVTEIRLSDPEDDDDDFVQGHPMVLSALLCAVLRCHGGTGLIARPVQLPLGTVVAFAQQEDGCEIVPIKDWRYISTAPVTCFDAGTLEDFYENLRVDHPFRDGLSFDTFAGPTSARDLTHCLATEIYDTIGELGDSNNDLTIDDVATARYACSLVDLLVPRSKRILTPFQRHNNTFLPFLAASMPRMRYPWDAELIRDILTKSAVSPQVLEEHLPKIKKAEEQDTSPKEPTRRSTLPSPPRFRVGDVLKARTGAGDPSWVVVTGWEFVNLEEAMMRKPGDAHLPDGNTMYLFIDQTGMHHGCNDLSLKPHTLTEDELCDATQLSDIGKWFKAVDQTGERPRFIIADDHAKLFPDD
ncbi:Mis6-domain-containing protein [Leucosporidium creatinivorum]|uniref:Mis6-domain-containing protein n=1 Tax=Leucosporidium creatinivorum TaxID=106004 RepID=A0A1Y2FX86_9BASI|nr:Mis6-domain-containing protein [Leucosporidium creatinivorum]